MSPAQLYLVMVQMKGLLNQNPDQARRILTASPHFAYALLQAQVRLGMTTPAMVQSVLVSPPPPLPTPTLLQPAQLAQLPRSPRLRSPAPTSPQMINKCY